MATWECTGLPCKHAARAIAYKREKLEDCCDGYSTVEMYLPAHGDMIHALLGISMVDYTNAEGYEVQPPPMKRLQGEPHKNRRREPDEAPPGDFKKRSGTVKCDNCKQLGHNRRTCQMAPVNSKESSSRNKGSVKDKSGNEVRCTPSSLQMETRSQRSSMTTVVSIQDRTRARMAARLQKKQKKRAKAREEKEVLESSIDVADV